MEKEKADFVFSAEGLPNSLKDKVSKLATLLNEPEIPMKDLMLLIQNGIPDEVPKIREACWKLLLGYLPSTKAKWT